MDLADLPGQLRVPDRPGRRLTGAMGAVRARGDLQDPADRIDPVLPAVLLDEGAHHLDGRSISAAKTAEACFRIVFARRSSRFSRSSSAGPRSA
ncbi:hypothetical protein [Sinomonas cyclohexanicum]|uniref:hypothetical protein n=1 Tax=Sinomonas cyclohexanicum TaxID=322009 RepID=UPI0035302EB7